MRGCSCKMLSLMLLISSMWKLCFSHSLLTVEILSPNQPIILVKSTWQVYKVHTGPWASQPEVLYWRLLQRLSSLPISQVRIRQCILNSFCYRYRLTLSFVLAMCNSLEVSYCLPIVKQKANLIANTQQSLNVLRLARITILFSVIQCTWICSNKVDKAT